MSRHLGELIRAARLGKGFSMRELARRSGVSHSYVALIEKGEMETPGPGVLKRLTEALPALDYGRLLKLAGHIDNPDELPEPDSGERVTMGQVEDVLEEEMAELGDRLGEQLAGIRLIPLVARVPASFEERGEVVLHLNGERRTVPVDEELIGEVDHPFALEVEGESMVEAGIMPGDLVVVDPEGEVTSGDVCVVRGDGEEHTLKEVRFANERVELVARGGNGTSRSFPRDAGDMPELVGKVVLTLRSYG